MNINVTSFVAGGTDFWPLSGSIATHGADAGPSTWASAKDQASEAPLLTTEAELEALRQWALGFGAWDEEEVAAWSPEECNALLIQYLAGDIQEAQRLCPGKGPADINWRAYEKLAEAGTCSGFIGRGVKRGTFWIYLDR